MIIQNPRKFLKLEDPIDLVVYLSPVIGYFAEISNAKEFGISHSFHSLFIFSEIPPISDTTAGLARIKSRKPENQQIARPWFRLPSASLSLINSAGLKLIFYSCTDLQAPFDGHSIDFIDFFRLKLNREWDSCSSAVSTWNFHQTKSHRIYVFKQASQPIYAIVAHYQINMILRSRRLKFILARFYVHCRGDFTYSLESDGNSCYKKGIKGEDNHGMRRRSGDDPWLYEIFWSLVAEALQVPVKTTHP